MTGVQTCALPIFLTIAGMKALAFEPETANLPVLIRMSQERKVLPLCAVPAEVARIEATYEVTGNYVRDCALTAPEGMNKAQALCFGMMIPAGELTIPEAVRELTTWEVTPDA